MDPEQPVAAIGDGMMLADFPDEAIDAIVAAAGAGSGSSLLSDDVFRSNHPIRLPAPRLRKAA